MLTVIDGKDGVDGEDGEDGEGNRRTENEKNIMEWTGTTGTDGKSTANRLERNSRSELYYIHWQYCVNHCVCRSSSYQGVLLLKTTNRKVISCYRNISLN